jgi:hypothetical protein
MEVQPSVALPKNRHTPMIDNIRDSLTSADNPPIIRTSYHACTHWPRPPPSDPTPMSKVGDTKRRTTQHPCLASFRKSNRPKTAFRPASEAANQNAGTPTCIELTGPASPGRVSPHTHAVQPRGSIQRITRTRGPEVCISRMRGGGCSVQ